MNDFIFYLLFGIQILFPLIAIVAMLYILSMVLTFQRSLPYVPSPKHAIQKMIEVAELRPGDHVVDFGSGTGTVTQAVASAGQNPITGIEHLIALVWISRIRRWVRFRHRKNYRLLRGDMFAFDLHHADVVLGFWIPRIYDRLIPKFEQETKKGDRIVSYLFPVPLSSKWRSTKFPITIRRAKQWIYKYERIS